MNQPVNSLVVEDQSPTTIPEEQLGIGHPRGAPAVTLRNYVLNTIASRALQNTNGSSAYPIHNYINCNWFSAKHQAFMVPITETVEPKTYNQAVLDKRWRRAMWTEVYALEANNTWTIKDLPPGKKALGCKWVYKVKYNFDGTIVRYKARLVVLVNRQIEGEDYAENFAPVAKMGTVRVFLQVVAGNGWDVHQMDVHNTFLHGDLKEEIYMKLSPGFNSVDNNKVCRIRKSKGIWISTITFELFSICIREMCGAFECFDLR